MHTLKFIISFVICFVFVEGFSQKKEQKSKIETKKDTIIYKTGYGLRLGVDISKLALPIIDKSYKGIEIVGDYRITKDWYIATELGYEKDITYEDFSQSTAKGNYIRIGANYNAYNNWLDMNNEIYVGGRYGFAKFEQTLNNYRANVNNSYFPAKLNTTATTENNLTAHWFEFQLGIKVETLKNLFVGFHGAYKIGLSIKEPKGFQTLYAPGFNRVFASKTGFGFNYTISYLIPFVKK